MVSMENRENVGKEEKKEKKEVLIIIPAYNEEKQSFRFWKNWNSRK